MIQETTIQVLHFTTTNTAQCSVTEVFNNANWSLVNKLPWTKGSSWSKITNHAIIYDRASQRYCR